MNTQYNIKPGDYIICIKSFIETEFRHSFTNDKRQVHLIKGSKYRVENISRKRKNYEIQELQVINEFGLPLWYSIDRFMTLKQWRKLKLKKLNQTNI